MGNEQEILIIKTIKNYDMIKEYYKKKKYNLVELDLSVIKDEQGLADEICHQLKFPHRPTNWDSVDDWITDLEWLETKNVAVLIKNFWLLKKKGFDQLFGVLKDAKEFWLRYDVTFDVIIFEEGTK